ncbi:MAG: efflux RND transporter permease subunit [Ignavibacteria bacterium]|jgi:HAE1 family hydrophobic/amphiphilic exporter-1
MFSAFFVRRPIFAIVISIVIVLVGTISLMRLPIEKFPALAPPIVRVQGSYPGASSEVVEQSVATPLEQKINGLDNQLSMLSKNTSDGNMKLDVAFEPGNDINVANMLVQSRASRATSRLPQEVNAQGLTISKVNPSILMVISIYSESGKYDGIFLNNFAMINVRDQLLRVPGISNVDLIGAEYAMRLWAQPDKMAKLGLVPTDVISALREQNIQAPAGKLGDVPGSKKQELTYSVLAPGKLSTPEEFENVIVREGAEGQVIRVRDVARAELGSEYYGMSSRYNGKPSTALIVYLMPGANQLESAKGIYQTLDKMQQTFPNDIKVQVGFDTTPAVQASIDEIFQTLLEAIALVILVVFIFLQNWRATLIPLLTVPVSLIGTFILFPALGFSINTLSLFGLVLAIGIVVDDAIVVVEAVMHHMEHGHPPREATLMAMKEVSGPVVAIALIFAAVFVPVGFMGGITGSMYLQFAITVAVSTLFSALSALTLSPALCVLLLKQPDPNKPSPLAPFYRAFNNVFGKFTSGYLTVATRLVRKSILAVVAVISFALLTGITVTNLPSGFVPAEDQGIIMVNIALPNAASQPRTDAVVRKVESILAKQEGVESYTSVVGVSFIADASTSNVASMFVRLKDWEERKDLIDTKIVGLLNAAFRSIPEAAVFSFSLPPVPGFGNASGLKFYLQDRSGGRSVTELAAETARFAEACSKRPELGPLFTQFDATVPQMKIDLDREKARKLGVPVDQVFQVLQSMLGGAYVNDFNKFGRLYRVFFQSESQFRERPSDIGAFFVRSATTGKMIPLSTLVNVSQTNGSEITYRYNLYRAVEISAQIGKGFSTGQAMQALEDVAQNSLPNGMSIEYAGLSYEQKRAPSPLPTFGMAVFFVFLLLAAQYNSWKLPWSVLLGTPVAAFGAFFGIWLTGLENDIFVQIGLILLIGLAAKNAILIVEFAKMRQEQGLSPQEAAIDSAKLRFRPILMTAFAFILGVVPLMTASGSGAGARKSVGTAVFYGMLIATIVGVTLAPALFAFIESRGKGQSNA